MVALLYGDMVMALLSPKAGLGWAQYGAGRRGLPWRDLAHGSLAPTLGNSCHYCEWQPMNWVSASSPVSCVHSPASCCAPAWGLPSFNPPEMFLPWSMLWGMLAGWEPPQSNSSRCHARPARPGFQQSHLPAPRPPKLPGRR